jgi:hypothetical protein
MLAAAAAGVACGTEEPDAAIYALAHDLEHDLPEAACERLVSADDLPADVARGVDRALSAPPEIVAVLRGRECPRRLDAGGLARKTGIHEPRVFSVERLDVPPQEPGRRCRARPRRFRA